MRSHNFSLLPPEAQKKTTMQLKMTAETPEVCSDKRKPKMAAMAAIAAMAVTAMSVMASMAAMAVMAAMAALAVMAVMANLKKCGADLY